MATILAGALATSVAFGCGDPMGSSNDPTIVTPNREYNGKLGTGDTAFYQHRSGASEAFAVLLKALTGSVTVGVKDSTGREVVPSVTATATPPLVGQAVTADIVPPSAGRYRITVTGDGQFRIQVLETETGPEHTSPHIVSDATIDEAIDGPADVDDFYLHGAPGDPVIAFVQALNPADSRQIELGVTGPGFGGTLVITSTSQDQELETQATPRFALESSEPYRFRVTGPHLGPFRLKVRRINRHPETVPSVPPENVAIQGERLDYVGDIDEFSLTAPPGTEYNVMFRVANGDSASSARLEISSREIHPVFFNVTSTGRDTLVADRATGRFAIGASGSAKLSVLSIDLTRGPYELFVYRIDPRPEQPKRELLLPDTVTAESIELPGDIDEYGLDVAGEDTVSLVLTPDSRSPWATPSYIAVEASLLTASGALVSRTQGRGDVVLTTGPTPIGPGRYRVRVASQLDKVDGYRGPYQLSAYRIRSAPEAGSASIAIGDIVSEAVDPAGDVDIYQINLSKGDHVDIRFQSVDSSGFGGLIAMLLRPVNRGLVAFVYGGPAPTPSLDQGGSGRVTVPETGRYEILVGSNNGGSVGSEHSRYRLMVRRFPAVPEHHAARLAVGEVVTDEALDVPGDVDEFFLEGQPGADVAPFVAAGPGAKGVTLQLVDPLTKDILATTMSEGDPAWLRRLVLPASGRVMLRVGETISMPFSITGSYRLEIVPISRAPELRAAAIAIGDTVSGETINPPADIDEFQFAGNAGQRVAGLLDTPLGFSHPGLVLEVISPGSGSVLGAVATYLPSNTFGDVHTQTVTLPASGTYVVRVRSLDELVTGGGPYRFAVVLR